MKRKREKEKKTLGKVRQKKRVFFKYEVLGKGAKKILVVGRRIYLVRGRGNGCPRLKVLQVPGKKTKQKKCPVNVCDLKICINRCMYVEENSV